MLIPKRVARWVLLVALAPVAVGMAQTKVDPRSKPITEDRIVRMIEREKQVVEHGYPLERSSTWPPNW